VLALLALAACGSGEPADRAQPAFTLTFEASAAPEVFDREGPARRSVRDTEGYWAVVQGLRRPESAVVRNLATGAEVTVALFAGRPAGGAAAELSVGAADALGIGEAPVQVRVTAVRDEPRVELP
jgi:hypothetical protein